MVSRVSISSPASAQLYETNIDVPCDPAYEEMLTIDPPGRLSSNSGRQARGAEERGLQRQADDGADAALPRRAHPPIVVDSAPVAAVIEAAFLADVRVAGPVFCVDGGGKPGATPFADLLAHEPLPTAHPYRR